MKKILLILLVSLCQAFFQDNLSDKETLVYRMKEGSKIVIITENVSLTTSQNINLHLIDIRSNDGGTAQIYLLKGSLKPFYLVYYDQQKNKIKEFKYNKDSVDVSIYDKKIFYNYELNQKDLWDMNSFFHLFRGYPADKKEVLFWSFLPDIKRGFLLYVKEVGDEEITFDQKKEKCTILEVGAAGFVESILFPQTFKFWIMKDSPHLFLKYSGKNLKGEEVITEVVKYSN
ncbi:MAG: hypothetical protein PHV30_05605 [Candidatus Margulisbacteria bacterium]|nr:hypothetical protein [Candidatus Margulisiibacteriota bacterium]